MGETIRVWDGAIRFFHWSLVLLFVLAYLTGEDESLLHIYAGYGILGLILFRLIWGIIGSHYARFSQFVVGSRHLAAYVRSLLHGRPKHYTGHNPLGGWMVLALLISLSFTTWTGLELYGAQGKGPMAESTHLVLPTAQADSDAHKNSRSEWWEEVHEFFANLTVLLIVIHIGGVVLSSRLHNENLVRAMVTGYKQIQ